LLGGDTPHFTQRKFTTVQALSGTGALRLAGAFLQRFLPPGTKLLLPDPTWANHIPIFEDSGFQLAKYRYYRASDCGLDLDGMLEDIDKAPRGSVVLLHTCAHNPTGVDPGTADWSAISKVVAKRDHKVLFDTAYQGFASGDPASDRLPLQQFAADGHEPVICQSFAKNFGMYGERVGAMTVLTDSADTAARVESQLKILIRPMYSNPPVFGAKIVQTILEDPALHKLWEKEVKAMADRIIGMRTALTHSLKRAGSTRNWAHISKQIGMFCYTGLTPQQVDRLAAEHSVYLTRNGRISIAGITPSNVDYLADAMHAVSNQ
jgi:aspartate aminotransferase